MTDNAGPTTPETPDGDRGDERLAGEEERAQLGAKPGSAVDDDGGGTAANGTPGTWPVVTVVLLTVAAWAPVMLTFLRFGFDPAPFAFRTDNVFWVLAVAGSTATMMLTAGVAGLHPRAAGSGALRIAAAAVTGVQLFVLVVIAVIQVLWEARAAIMAQTAFTIVALALAAGAVVIALGAARADRNGTLTPFWGRAPVIGLACVLVGQTVLAVGRTAQFPGEFAIYVVSLLISMLTALASLIGLWLVGRTRVVAGWTGAAILCLLAVLSLGSLVNVFALVELPLSHRLVEAGQYLLFAGGAVTAVLAARAGARGASAGAEDAPVRP